MKLIIFGSSGLVGSNLVARLKTDPLASEYRLLLPRKIEVDLLNFDLVSRYISKEMPDAVVNLAGKVGGIQINSDRGGDFYFENILMNANLYHACALNKIGYLVNLGAGCGYPLTAPEPLREESIFDGLPQPESLGYSMAKKMLIVQETIYRAQYALKSVVIIPSNIYGPYDNFSLYDSHVVPALIRKFEDVAAGRAQEVVVWGDGSARRDFIHAGDVSDAILKSVSRRLVGTYNVGSGCQTSISEVVELLSSISGVDAVRFDHDRPSGQSSRQFSVKKFVDCCPDFVARPLSAGLGETFEWFRAQRAVGGALRL